MAVFGPVVPVIRIFDERKAKEFYVEFLGFKVEFEHRFGDDFPLYMGVSLSNCVLHLTEHYGDASPGAQVRVETDDIARFAEGLARKDYRYAKPGAPEPTPWGTTELCITDPFGNRLRFVQRQQSAANDPAPS
jgi:uncharacterized glyoxalase superfamily protein PhnB